MKDKPTIRIDAVSLLIPLLLLAREIAQKIEDELEYPGQIKVNLIRETKAIDYAK